MIIKSPHPWPHPGSHRSKAQAAKHCCPSPRIPKRRASCLQPCARRRWLQALILRGSWNHQKLCLACSWLCAIRHPIWCGCCARIGRAVPISCIKIRQRVCRRSSARQRQPGRLVRAKPLSWRVCGGVNNPLLCWLHCLIWADCGVWIRSPMP